MHPGGSGFFSFSFRGGVVLLDFCCSQCVPQHVHNSSSLCLISFALSPTLGTPINQPKGGGYNIYFGTGKSFDLKIK